MAHVARCSVCAGSGFLLRRVCPLCDGCPGFPNDETSDVVDTQCRYVPTHDSPDTVAEPCCPARRSLLELSEQILADLERYEPVTLPGMDRALHYLAPHVAKSRWDALGDLVSAGEKVSSGKVPGHRWISLRLDGSGFSRTVRSMRRCGILEAAGFSERFATVMQACLRALMEKLHCHLGYTQSDEMVVFLAPASVVRGEQQVHVYAGRVAKLISLSAGYVTSNFVLRLAQLCTASGVRTDDLVGLAPHFDCRLGTYDSWEEARSLLLWRAQDCSVNGISDAVYHTPGSGKAIQGKDKIEKLRWLWERGSLPLPRHQAYGTVLAKAKRLVEGFNPHKQEKVTSLRGVIEQVHGPVLELARTGTLIPLDDTPP